jgi:hypothetical protein
MCGHLQLYDKERDKYPTLQYILEEYFTLEGRYVAEI